MDKNVASSQQATAVSVSNHNFVLLILLVVPLYLTPKLQYLKFKEGAILSDSHTTIYILT